MPVNSSKIRRWTYFALAAAAIGGALVAVAFVAFWTGYVEEFQPDYFRSQGLGWADEYRGRLESLMVRYLDEQPHTQVARWQETFPPWVEAEMSAQMAADGVSRPRFLAVTSRQDRRVVARLGESLAKDPGFDDLQRDEASGLAIAVLGSDDEGYRVLVEGPLVADEPLRDGYSFHCILEFRPFLQGAKPGRTYAVILVLVYLAMLYGLLLLVFFLGRREMSLAFAAKERDIRLRAIGSVAEGIAHEVRNPLNAISLNVQYLERVPAKLGRAPEPQDFQRVHMELGKIRKVIDNFVSFARLRDIELTEWEMGELVDEVLADLGPSFEERGIAVEVDAGPGHRLAADRPKIRQVLAGILRNARDAVLDAERKEVTVRVREADKMLRLEVRDTGPEPTPKVLANMFDPYFTTSSSAMGLGLTLAKTVVESHGGAITASAHPGGGCVVAFELPRQQAV